MRDYGHLDSAVQAVVLLERILDDINKIADTKGNGMSLRDYFAAKALAGVLACPDTSGDAEGFARTAYLCADAMLSERDRKGGGE